MGDLKEAIANYWAIYDFSGDGYLTFDEAQRLFTDLFAQIGQRISKDDCRSLFNYIDSKEEQRITQGGLLRALTNR